MVIVILIALLWIIQHNHDYYSRFNNYLAISVFAIFLFQFFEILKIFEILNISENILKTVGFLGKIYRKCFVATLSSFLDNFELSQSVQYCQSYKIKMSSLIFISFEKLHT